MAKIDITKIDRNMQQQKIDPAGLRWLDPRDGGFQVLGLYWFDREKRYHRFPKKITRRILRPELISLAACPAGGQLRFRTDSRRIVIAVKNTPSVGSGKMPETNRSGCDLYLGGPGQEVYWSTGWPVPGKSEYTSELFSSKEKKMRDFRLNLPLYNGVKNLLLAIETDAELVPPTPLPIQKPVVIYGTSITQGGCGSRPGSTFTNRLSRSLQVEFLNFGFSGQGKNDPEMAELLTEIDDPAMFILDSQANSINPAYVRERVPRFLDILRKRYPELPIVIVTKIIYGPRYSLDVQMKQEFKKIYQRRKKAGDRNLYFIDGSKCWPETDTENTVDGVHPTDAGFEKMALYLEPRLRKILESYGYSVNG